MKLKNFLTILPLALATVTAFAETATTEAATAGTVVSVEKNKPQTLVFQPK